MPAPGGINQLEVRSPEPLQTLGGFRQVNGWNFWLYPAQVETSAPSDVFVTERLEDARNSFAAGGKVLFHSGGR